MNWMLSVFLGFWSCSHFSLRVPLEYNMNKKQHQNQLEYYSVNSPGMLDNRMDSLIILTNPTTTIHNPVVQYRCKSCITCVHLSGIFVSMCLWCGELWLIRISGYCCCCSVVCLLIWFCCWDVTWYMWCPRCFIGHPDLVCGMSQVLHGTSQISMWDVPSAVWDVPGAVWDIPTQYNLMTYSVLYLSNTVCFDWFA